jgi:hypothetical protein
MQLRHISPRSIDWKDAMDEGMGGRGWERLAPEERVKLLRERRDEDGDLSRAGPSGGAPVRDGHAQGFAMASASK